ncbi:TPA: hypothetical protein RUY84_002834 [Vibrio cholerae]|nr:hypothetical protein [Vibrio cholerae]
MAALYKIESYSDEAARQIGGFITEHGGRCVVAGFAVITDHLFQHCDAFQVLPLVARTSDQLSEWDYQQFSY